MEDFGFWLFLTVVTVLCSGEPDLIDALIHFLMK